MDIRVIVPRDATVAVTPELHEGSLLSFEYGLRRSDRIVERDELHIEPS